MNRLVSPLQAPQKPDGRRLRTRRACLGAFIDLLLTSDYESLTVNAVIERAKVGRSTFYEHFTGKEDLLRAVVSNPLALLADGLDEAADPAPLAGVLAHFRAQRPLARRLLGGEARTMMVRSLAGLIAERLGAAWPRGKAAAAPLRLAALAVAELQLGMVGHWLEQSVAECPAEAYARILAQASRAVAASCRSAEGL